MKSDTTQYVQHPHEAHVCQTWAPPAASPRRPRGGRRHAGFSLMEVLVALGIFTVGLVAVAAIFPTAITIQRDTVREVDAQRVGKNARAVALAIALTDSSVNDGDPTAELNYSANKAVGSRGSLENFVRLAAIATAVNPTPVLPMIDQPGLTAPQSFGVLFNLDTRSYPKRIHDPLLRDYYWYPLLRVADATSKNPKLSMILVVMHRDGTDRVPELRRSEINTIDRKTSTIHFGNKLPVGDGTNDEDGDNLPDYIQAGDQIIGDDGNIHTVIIADGGSVTVDSANIGNPKYFYFGVSMDSTGLIKRERRSPVVWIEDGIALSINK